MTKKREFLDRRVTNITSGGHKQKGLNLLLFFNFLTSEEYENNEKNVMMKSTN
jgi:hypothetical protein